MIPILLVMPGLIGHLLRVTSNLPPELSGPNAMIYWHRAQEGKIIERLSQGRYRKLNNPKNN